MRPASLWAGAGQNVGAPGDRARDGVKGMVNAVRDVRDGVNDIFED